LLALAKQGNEARQAEPPQLTALVWIEADRAILRCNQLSRVPCGAAAPPAADAVNPRQMQGIGGR